jgi:hypothetical protein
MMRSGARREDGQGLTAFDRNFDIVFGRAEFGRILMLTLGVGGVVYVGRNFYVNIGRAA